MSLVEEGRHQRAAPAGAGERRRRAYTTAADVSGLWAALDAGRVVSRETLAEMVRPDSDVPSENARHGLGLWLDRTGDGVRLVGGDAGVSFMSSHDQGRGVTWTVLSNTTDGAWPVARRLEELLG